MDYMNLLENIVNDLYEKQNIGALPEQQGLYTKQQYYELLKPVADIVINHKDLTIEEMRHILFKQSGIEQKVNDFIHKKEMVPGMVFTYGTKNYRETVVIGNKQEVSLDANGKLVPSIETMTDDTIFDLASVTKLFTSLSILKLVEKGVIKLEDEITRYVPELVNLKGITIFDLISFRVPLRTDGRIDGVSKEEEAIEIFKTMRVNPDFKPNTNPYTDMGAMVLKYVIENASGMNYYSFVDENIIKPLGLVDTYANVPKYKLDRLASSTIETQIMADEKIVDYEYNLGNVNDAKARILSGNNNVAGHAGLFSSADDMVNLAKGIMNGKVIDDKYVEEMAKNRTGYSYVEDDKTKYVQYLGYLCYSKNPILASSEVFHAMSGKTFASAGWAGSYLTVDPINELYLFMSANKTHNRITRLANKEFREQVVTDENGKKTLLLPDGRIKVDATRYAWDRDEAVVHPALNLAIQYKALEDILEYNKVEEKQENNIIHF